MLSRAHVVTTALAITALSVFFAGCSSRYLGVNHAGEKLRRERPIHSVVGHYLLSRVLDTVDIITINAGIGPALHLEGHITQAARLGVGGAYLASVGTGSAPREAGFFGRGIAEVALLPWHAQIVHWDEFLSTGTDYDLSAVEFRTPEQQLFRKKVDYWSVGISGGVLIIGGQIEIHPVQIGDWFLGWFTVDFLNDDL